DAEEMNLISTMGNFLLHLCNGTRLICKRFTEHLIEATIAVGDQAGDIVYIPRIVLHSSETDPLPSF
ncbi:hypothetical protein DFQ28_001498, partial [Apophysomyces sp. BC1034]